MKIARLVIVLGIIIVSLLWATPVFAIDPPDLVNTINNVDAYRNLVETNDQLFIIEYTIDYTANPDENITEAFIARIMDGTDELGSQAPYAYYDDGYDRGIVAIYFEADDPNLPTWGSSYTVKLEGNPTLTWGGAGRPITSSTSISWTSSSDQPAALAAKVLYLADQLELAWSVDLIETSGFGSRLTDYGSSYFSSAIPHLITICPEIFGGSSVNPDIIDRANNRGAETYLTNRASNTILDPEPAADSIGISSSSFGISMSILFILVILALFAKHIPGSGILTLLTVPLLIMFTLAGWILLGYTIAISVLACIATIYIFTLEKSAT